MKRTRLRDFEDDLAKLGRYSFVRRDEHSSDSVRWVWFERVLDSDESQIRFVIRIEFELAISDDPGATDRDNHSYSFNGIILEVINRQMERYDSVMYDPDTEQPEVVGQYRLAIDTLREVNQLTRLLGAGLHVSKII